MTGGECEMTFRITRRAFAAGAVAGLAGAGTLSAQRASEAAARATPYQTLGPFYPNQRPFEDDADLTWLDGHDQRAAGQVIEVGGRVLDIHGNPVSNARLEIWQANAAGRYAHANDVGNSGPLDPNFQGFADIRTGRDGTWRITTIKPGAYGSRTQHIHFDVTGRHQRLITQMYFPDEEENNQRDGPLRYAGDRANLLMSHKTGEASYHWDIVLMDGVD